jgi:hypothetical protein
MFEEKKKRKIFSSFIYLFNFLILSFSFTSLFFLSRHNFYSKCENFINIYNIYLLLLFYWKNTFEYMEQIEREMKIN